MCIWLCVCLSVRPSWGGCEQCGHTLIPLRIIDIIRTVQFPILYSFWNFDFYVIRLYCDLIVVLRAQHNGWTLWLFKHTDPWSHPGPIYTLRDLLKLFMSQYPQLRDSNNNAYFLGWLLSMYKLPNAAHGNHHYYWQHTLCWHVLWGVTEENIEKRTVSLCNIIFFT